ncbi:phosphotransferase [Lacticaseibacillus sp. N501-2]|uniref:phosphotransferase n=1 Tax=Lacticaseibacillus salsurae TaxID=3367729 RepID=UPI0038B400FF
MNIFEKQASFYLLQSDLTQRELSQKMVCSLGTVNKTLKSLVNHDWLYSDRTPTQKLLKLMSCNNPKRAIILAAGFGVRSVPLNITTPKPLIEVNGERLIERLIGQLHQADVTDITIVVGFMKERFEYLIDQYGVSLVFNEEYKRFNNICSLGLASDQLENAYIVPGDVWLKENPFSKADFYSWYLVSRKADPYSPVRIGRQGEFHIRNGKEDPGIKMIGVAYVASDVSSRIAVELKQAMTDPTRQQMFWENVLLGNDALIESFVPRILPENEVVDINTYEDLRTIDGLSSQLNSSVIALISRVLKVSKNEIGNIMPLKKGMTNRSFSFLARDRKYIMRVPGEGTSKLINRKNEARVYHLIRDFSFVEKVTYINPDNGYKISEYLDGARNSNPEDKAEVRQCLEILRTLHHQKVRSGSRFELFKQIEFYESFWGMQPSVFEDYTETKRRVYQLRKFVLNHKNQDVLCHIDANFDNFVFAGRKGNRSLKLIDWEYAGEQDPLVDIAMFAIYADYSQAQVDWLLSEYLEGKVTSRDRALLYSYISICGLLWSNWCQYKQNLGVEFGEYFMHQYRFAKEYSKSALRQIALMED